MSKKILIIEDDEFLGDVLTKKVQNAGFEVELAVDGGVGLARITEYMPDLILLDIMLPTLNGYEILEAKAKDEKISKIPVIIISNSGQPVEISRVLSLGVKDYLVKAQFDPEEVIIKVKAQLESPGTEVKTDGSTVSSSGKLAGKKIMWVEDDAFLSDIITRKFQNENCTLIHLSEGEGALAKAKEGKPDIVLLDILLAGMSGYDILEALKKDPETALIPVILLSNLGQKSDVEKGEKLGAKKFIIKAMATLDDIIAEISEVLVEAGKK
jgi:DNA-binding response OmpR family regulator